MLVLVGGQVFAEEGAYQIELIAFAQAMPTTEVFEQTSSQLKWPTVLTELDAYHKPDHLALADTYAALSQDSTYRPMLHLAWVSPLNVPVHIHSSDGKLNGYIQLQPGQVLQLLVDVELTADTLDGAGVVYRLNEKRPVKSGEIYYLDHPKFGLVVKVAQG